MLERDRLLYTTLSLGHALRVVYAHRAVKRVAPFDVHRFVAPALRLPLDPLSLLWCPATHKTPLVRSGGWIRCAASGRAWREHDGVMDFLGDDGHRPHPAQRVMESELYSLGYEEVFRPRLTRLVTRQRIPDAIALHVAMLALAPHLSVVDVACGTGNFTRSIAAHAGVTIGLDRSLPMLRGAAQRAGNAAIGWVRADALRMPVRTGSVDRIHCAGALHLMPDTVGVLREWCRVLKPNGRIVVGTFVEASDARIRRLQQLSGRWSGFRFFGRGTLDAALLEAGLELVEEVIEGAALSFAACRARRP